MRANAALCPIAGWPGAVTPAYRRPTWWNDPRLRMPLLLAGLVGGGGGLVIAFGSSRSGETRTDKIGDIFASGFTWVGIILAPGSAAANLVIYLWAKGPPPASDQQPAVSN